MSSFFEDSKGIIEAITSILIFFKKYKKGISYFIGISLMIFQSFKIEHIERLLKKSAPMFDIKIEYTENLTPLATQLVSKCGKHCFFGIAFLKYDDILGEYIGTNFELFGINEENTIETVLDKQLFNASRKIEYGTCLSNIMEAIMNSTHSTATVNIKSLIKKCPDDREALQKMFFEPQEDINGKHIACGNWKTIVNKATVSVLKSSIGNKAYAIIWLSMTNPIMGDRECTVDYNNFSTTGCDKDDCEKDMRTIAKRGKEFTNEYGLR